MSKKETHTLIISFSREVGDREQVLLHIDDNASWQLPQELEYAIEEIETAYDDIIEYHYFILRKTTTVSYTEILAEGDVNDFYNPVLQGA